MGAENYSFYPIGPALPHQTVDKWRAIWKKCRDVLAGEEAIKDAGTEYLPKMSRMTDFEYESYKQRALFYGASQRTMQGLIGSILRKPPVIYASTDELVTKVTDLVKNITQTGVDLHGFTRDLVAEILSVGRVGVLVDAPPANAKLLTQRPYARMYTAEEIINWRMHFVAGVPVLDQVVLLEVINTPGPDGFGIDQVVQYRELTLNEDGSYVQRVWVIDPPKTEKDDATIRMLDEVIPTYRGKPMGKLPFFFCSASHNRPDVERPPLLDLFNVNISHYRSSADLEHGRHYTALPTPVVSGVDNDEDGATPSLEIGSSTAWLLPTGAQAKMLEFNGQGLKHLENALSEKATLMTHLGARMLEPDKRSAETAEALRLRQAGDFASMNTISDAVGAMLTDVVRLMAWWYEINKELDDDTLFVQLNKDYFESRLTPAMLTALVTSWQAGAMGFRDLYFNLVRGETIDPERSFDEVFDEVMKEAKIREASVNTATNGITPRQGQGTTATAKP